MNTRSQKISLLSEMIAFALVDGDLHDKEYDFLQLLATELGIEKAAFLDLFRKRDKIVPIKSEFERISHFYKLALLMYCDDLIHKSEDVTIHKIGIKMGLNPQAMNRILSMMKCAPNHIVAPEIVVGAFQEQYN
jgi:Tellurite resistance protein TerB